MTTHLFPARVVPMPRRWWVIDEIDLVPMIAGHAALARLCDALEACADALPARPGRAEAARLCDLLEGLDEKLPLAALLGGCDAEVAVALDQCRLRRAADVAHAQDLAAALRDPRSSADMLGYMLRCFFLGFRRAIQVEQLLLLGFARGRLTPDARAMLVDGLGRGGA